MTAAVWALFGLLTAMLGVLSTALFSLGSDLRGNTARIDNLADRLDARIDSLANRIDATSSELRADMNARFETIDADIGELRTALRA